MEALTGRVEVISRQSPVLLVLEDAHWADPSSLEAFGRLIDKIAALRAALGDFPAGISKRLGSGGLM